MAKKRKNVYGPYKGYYPQKYLQEYLEIDIDPFDFPKHMLDQWAEENGVKLGEDDYTDSLNPDQLKSYEKWLKENDKAVEFLEWTPAEAPAYLTLSWPEKLPKGTWGIHYTNVPGVDEFRYGATIPKLALSTWWNEKDQARCPENLGNELGSYDYVYSFAFPVEGKGAVSPFHGSKYGRNAIVFQTNAAILAYHNGDEEWQMIFPACSEYNVIPVSLDGTEVTCAFEDGEGEALTFDSVKDLIEYVEKAEGLGERPLERLKC